MKKQVLSVLGLMSFFGIAMAQQESTLKPCNTYQAMEEVLQKDPNAQTRFNLVQSQLELEYQNNNSLLHSQAKVATPVYTVPVVFHVMGPQNISDQVFINAIAQVNKDFARKGSDTGTINTNFKSLYVNADIVFALAKKDPNGNCTNGIIRHNSDDIYWNQANLSAYAYSGSGTNRWPTNQYLNVYVVNCIYNTTDGTLCPAVSGGSYIGGYTYLPGIWSVNASQDAIVYLAKLLGQSSINDARALSHEIGHWLNLNHTFGALNQAGTNCGDDNISDTPPTKGILSQCPTSNSNTCSGSGNIWNVENFMDYSSCPKMFTQEQVSVMRTAIASTAGGRNNVWSPSNLVATGITGSYTCSPIANFTSNKVVSCVNTSVVYTDQSQVGNSGSLTWTFQGGSPSISTSTAPSITYTNPGTYSVSLTATNGNGSNTIKRVSYVTVLNGTGGATTPYLIDFEGAGLPSNVSVTNNNSGSVSWIQSTSVGGNSTSKSIYLPTSSSTGGHLDVFETPFYNFTNTSAVSISYYYAYAKKTASQADTFKVQYSLDCGGSWTNVLGIPNVTSMANNSGGTTATPFVPTAAQWKQTSINSALLTALTNKPSVKFRFYFRSDISSGSSNSIYIDQINLSGTVGINELENALSLSLYPNPTSASATVELENTTGEPIRVTVVDLLGRVVEESNKPETNGTYMKYTINQNGTLTNGVYVVNIDVNHQRISKKLVIQ